MANITQYSNPDTSLNLEGFQQAARRVGAFATQEAATTQEQGRQLGQGIEQGTREIGQTVEQHVDYWDKTRVAARSTAVMADIEQQWQATLKGTPDPNNPGKFITPPADPTDPNVAKRFQQDVVEPALDDLKKTPVGLNGADYAENKAAELRQHFQISSTADMATLAGKAVVLSDMRTTNNLSALVSTEPSFHNVDFALKQLDDLSTAHQGVGTMTAETVAELKIHNEGNKEAVVHAAAAAAIQKDGVDPVKVAQSFIDKYPDYIKPAETIQLAKAAQQQQKINVSLDRAAQADQDRVAARNAVSSVNDIRVHVMENGGPTAQDTKDLIAAIKANPKGFGSHEGLSSSTYDWLQGQATKEMKEPDDPKVVDPLRQAVLNGDANIKDLMKANTPGGGMSTATFKQLSEDMTLLDKQSPEEKQMLETHLKDVEATLHPPKGMFDSLDPSINAGQMHAISKYQQWFQPWYAAQLKLGGKPQDLLSDRPGMAGDPKILAKFMYTGGSMPNPADVDEAGKPKKSIQDIFNGK